jgi:hypothetical protein
MPAHGISKAFWPNWECIGDCDRQRTVSGWDHAGFINNNRDSTHG